MKYKDPRLASQYPHQKLDISDDLQTITIESANDLSLREFLTNETGVFQSRDIHIKSGNWRPRTINLPFNQQKSKKKHINFFYFWSFFIKTQHNLCLNGRWKPAGASGSEKPEKREIVIEINQIEFMYFKNQMLNLAKEIANNNINRWLNNWRKEVKRGSLSLALFKERKKFWGDFTSYPVNKKEIFNKQKSYYIQNIAKSLDEVITRIVMSKKTPTNYNIMRIADKTPRKISSFVQDVNQKNVEIQEVMDILNLKKALKHGLEVDSESDLRGIGAAIIFKCQIDYLNKNLPENSPLNLFLGIEDNMLSKCQLELNWGSMHDYRDSRFAIADSFAPDVVVRNKYNNKVLAIIQLKGKSQFESTKNGRSSFIQIIELKKYELETKMKIAFVHVRVNNSSLDKNGWVLFEWLVSTMGPFRWYSKKFDRYYERLMNLNQFLVKNPAIDPLILRNLIKKEKIRSLYNRMISNSSGNSIEHYIEETKGVIIQSQKNFLDFACAEIDETESNIKFKTDYLDRLKMDLSTILEETKVTDSLKNPKKFFRLWEQLLCDRFINEINEIFFDIR